jgi:hypothetical protein
MHSTLLYDIDSRLEDMRRDLEEVAERVKDDLPRLRAAIERLTLTVKAVYSLLLCFQSRERQVHEHR